jgi:hypothetical protein
MPSLTLPRTAKLKKKLGNIIIVLGSEQPFPCSLFLPFLCFALVTNIISRRKIGNYYFEVLHSTVVVCTSRFLVVLRHFHPFIHQAPPRGGRWSARPFFHLSICRRVDLSICTVFLLNGCYQDMSLPISKTCLLP